MPSTMRTRRRHRRRGCCSSAPLGSRASRRTLASFDIATEARATDNRMGAMVEAMEQAANAALTQAIERSAAALADQR